jgi:hypothetical protein
MATASQLEKELAQTRGQLNQVLQILEREGLLLPAPAAVDPVDRPDYIPFGSEKHQIFLGLVEVEDKERAISQGWTVYTSPSSGTHYYLADEIAAVQRGRGMDSEKAILFELRQKVGSFESGSPKVPAWAPNLFEPPGVNFERIDRQ